MREDQQTEDGRKIEALPGKLQHSSERLLWAALAHLAAFCTRLLRWEGATTANPPGHLQASSNGLELPNHHLTAPPPAPPLPAALLSGGWAEAAAPAGGA